MPSNEVPQAVLAETLAEKIDGRRVRAAVFTTFSFDPGFFELHILPTLFDVNFSQVDKVRRIQLEDSLRTVQDISVYYDHSALAQDSLPAQLGFRRIAVRGPAGYVFHPKLVLVLAENPAEDSEGPPKPGPQSLIVGCLSANLTRAGWWENLEVGHFEEMQDKDWSREFYPYRKDLLALLRRIRDLAGSPAEQPGLELIREFLKNRTSPETSRQNSAAGRHYTRLFFGQSALPDWLREIRLDTAQWNLEVISPYFDGADGATLSAITDVLQPRETRIYLPQAADGSCCVRRELYDAIHGIATWAGLPATLTRPGARAKTKEAVPRFVHAKVYRLWNKTGKQVVLVGSVNLTQAAHKRVGTGNLEAGFLVDISGVGIPTRWWLQKLEFEPCEFLAENPREDSEADAVFSDIAFQFDWTTDQLKYRASSSDGQALKIGEPSGRQLFSLVPVDSQNGWVDCGPAASLAVKSLLMSTSLLLVVHPQGAWRVLVREEGVIHRPSLLATLTPEEILMYWSLLSPAQKEAFILEKLAGEGQLQGLAPRTHRYQARDSIFDRFAGIYHAFEQLYQHVVASLERGDVRDAETRLFGAKYDSLPELLHKTLEHNHDPVMRYLLFLCGKQACERVRRFDGEFWKSHRVDRERIEELLQQIPRLAEALPLEHDDRTKFLSWFETMFLKVIPVPEVVG